MRDKKRWAAWVLALAFVLGALEAPVRAEAAAGRKSCTCAVRVRDFALTNTKEKDAAEVRALAQIIRRQNAQGALLSTDLNDQEQYTWNADGNLTGIDWSDRGLTGSLSLKGFPVLERLLCGRMDYSSAVPAHENQLRSLDLSNNAALNELHCSNNAITFLDLSGNPALKELCCLSNPLSSLDVSSNQELHTLYCEKSVAVTGYEGEIISFYSSEQ